MSVEKWRYTIDVAIKNQILDDFEYILMRGVWREGIWTNTVTNCT